MCKKTGHICRIKYQNIRKIQNVIESAHSLTQRLKKGYIWVIINRAWRWGFRACALYIDRQAIFRYGTRYKYWNRISINKLFYWHKKVLYGWLKWGILTKYNRKDSSYLPVQRRWSLIGQDWILHTPISCLHNNISKQSVTIKYLFFFTILMQCLLNYIFSKSCKIPHLILSKV